MLYSAFQGIQLPRLGLGCMRFPKLEGTSEAIDHDKARAMIHRAYEAGVNYFDTAYRYHGGESETFVGEVLSLYPRDSFYLASKMPGHMMEFVDGQYRFTGALKERAPMPPRELFLSQLQRCQVDYFDFYMLHNLCETAYEFYSDPDLGVLDELIRQKDAGRIRYLGFSAHGRAETLDSYLNEHPGVFQFAQIQLNYLDWTLQDARSKCEVLAKHGLPLLVMEPVRGGRLAALTESQTEILRSFRPDASPAEWAFRFLQTLPGVQLVLSGMSSMAQLEENIATFCEEKPLTQPEWDALMKIGAEMTGGVPCTSCRYCVEDCPVGLNIPKLLSMYNESVSVPNAFTMGFTLGAMSESELPSACLSCGACSRACPQNIDIPSALSKFAALLSAI